MTHSIGLYLRLPYTRSLGLKIFANIRYSDATDSATASRPVEQRIAKNYLFPILLR